MTAIGEAAMIFLGGRRFTCECGANVFTRREDNTYSCNACQAMYESA